MGTNGLRHDSCSENAQTQSCLLLGGVKRRLHATKQQEAPNRKHGSGCTRVVVYLWEETGRGRRALRAATSIHLHRPWHLRRYCFPHGEHRAHVGGIATQPRPALAPSRLPWPVCADGLPQCVSDAATCWPLHAEAYLAVPPDTAPLCVLHT